VQNVCFRQAYAKSVLDYHHGLSDPSRPSQLNRIPCQGAILRSLVSLMSTHYVMRHFLPVSTRICMPAQFLVIKMPPSRNDKYSQITGQFYMTTYVCLLVHTYCMVSLYRRRFSCVTRIYIYVLFMLELAPHQTRRQLPKVVSIPSFPLFKSFFSLERIYRGFAYVSWLCTVPQRKYVSISLFHSLSITIFES